VEYFDVLDYMYCSFIGIRADAVLGIDPVDRDADDYQLHDRVKRISCDSCNGCYRSANDGAGEGVFGVIKARKRYK
jgi:hypothetical protein